MKHIIASLCLFFSIPAFSTDYSCDIFNNGQKTKTLPGSMPNDNRIASATNNTLTDPNLVLAYTLCQQAGFQLVNTQVSVPGIRNTSNVTKIQQIPDPACSLKCTAIS